MKKILLYIFLILSFGFYNYTFAVEYNLDDEGTPGIAVSGTTYTTTNCAINGCREWDGVDDTGTTYEYWNFGNSFSWSVGGWINIEDETPATAEFLFTNDADELSPGYFHFYFLRLTNGNLRLNAWESGYSGTQTQIESNTSLSVGLNHIFVTYNGTTFTLYLNGENVGSGTRNFTCDHNNTRNIAIGRNGDDNNLNFTGNFDELVFTNTALSQSTIQDYYNQYTTGPITNYGTLTTTGSGFTLENFETTATGNLIITIDKDGIPSQEYNLGFYNGFEDSLYTDTPYTFDFYGPQYFDHTGNFDVNFTFYDTLSNSYEVQDFNIDTPDVVFSYFRGNITQDYYGFTMYNFQPYDIDPPASIYFEIGLTGSGVQETTQNYVRSGSPETIIVDEQYHPTPGTYTATGYLTFNQLIHPIETIEYTTTYLAPETYQPNVQTIFTYDYDVNSDGEISWGEGLNGVFTMLKYHVQGVLNIGEKIQETQEILGQATQSGSKNFENENEVNNEGVAGQVLGNINVDNNNIIGKFYNFVKYFIILLFVIVIFVVFYLIIKK